MDPKGDGDFQGLAQGRRLAQVPRSAPHAQPMHRHGVDGLALQAVDTHIGGAGFGILGDHQAQGDHAAGVPRPRPQQGQVVQVDLVALQHHLAAGRRQIPVRPSSGQVPKQAAIALQIGQALGGARLLEQGQAFAEGLQFLRSLHTHRPEHPLHGAEQVDGHRHR